MGCKSIFSNDTFFLNLNELKDIYTSNLKTLRSQKGLSQNQVSEKANITEKFYSDIETGRKWGSFETLINISNALEIEPYELLLPQDQNVNYDSKRTKQLIKHLRSNFCAVVDTMEMFLEDK